MRRVKIIGLSLEPRVLRQVDEIRGDVSRSRYISKLIINTIQVDNQDQDSTIARLLSASATNSNSKPKESAKSIEKEWQ